MTDLAGMTKTSCPSACNADRCVISDAGCCSHPLQGGLQRALKNESSLVRYDDACKFLGVKNVHTIPERLAP